jgi:methionine sulfoxide reductase heme-binding subunit
MINSINRFLSPLENLIRSYRKYIGYFLIFLALLSPLYFFDDMSIKSTGEKSITILWIILWMPILARVFGLRIFAQLLPLRKELGILMGVLAVVHGFSFIIPNQEIMESGAAVFQDGKPTFIFYGLIAMWLSVPLTLTSSVWAMRKMGRYWKYLHRLVYIIAILVVAHVVILKSVIGQFNPAPIIFLGLYFFFKALEWKKFSFLKK